MSTELDTILWVVCTHPTRTRTQLRIAYYDRRNAVKEKNRLKADDGWKESQLSIFMIPVGDQR